MSTLKVKKSGTKSNRGVKSSSYKKNHLKQVVRNTDYRQYQDGAVLYVGHVPCGFFEHEMRGYFSQFGRVGRIQLCRSKKTGKSKGYAFVEFQSKDVAEIAAEAMNNYLMFRKLMKCHLVPDEKVHPNLFKNSDSYKKHLVLPHVMNKRRHNQHQTDEQLKKSVEKMMRKKRKLVNKLSEMGINYELPAEMFKMNKLEQAQMDDGDGDDDDDDELVSAKRRKLSSPENKQSLSIPKRQSLETSTKSKRKQKRSASDEATGILDQEEQSLPVKKQKCVSPGSKQTASTPDRLTVKMIRTPDVKRSIKKACTKMTRQSEDEEVQRQPNDGEECEEELLSAKKQKIASPKAKKTTSEINTSVTIVTESGDVKKTSQKVKQGIMQAEEDEGRIQENNGRALSAKKQATPKTKQNTSPQTTPAMCTLRTPDGKKSAKKTSKKAVIDKFECSEENVASKVTRTPSPQNTPITGKSKVDDVLKSTKKSPKQFQVAVDVGTKHEKREVVREGLSPLPNRRKSATPKIQQTLSLPITPVTMTTKTPEVRKSARKTPKKMNKTQAEDEDVEEICSPGKTPKNKYIASTPGSRITRSRNTANIKVTQKKEQRVEGEESDADEGFSKNLTRTPASTPKHKQTILTPSTRVTRSSQILDVKTPKSVDSPSQKIKTPGRKTSTEVRHGSTKNKTAKE